MGREAIVAQLVLERSAFNRMVAGSNPADGIPPFFYFHFLNVWKSVIKWFILYHTIEN